MGILLIFFLAAVALLGYRALQHPVYRAYREASGNSWRRVLGDKGSYGEYLTFAKLSKLEGCRLLANLYVIKPDGTTTEIDLVLLSEYGIYVIESKNFGGWIFGSESSKYWTQMFNRQKRYQFFNPIWQNAGHISALKSVLHIQESESYKSVIVFSERCSLKQVSAGSSGAAIMKRNVLLQLIKEDMLRSTNRFSPADLDEMHRRLKRYALADEQTKAQHIRTIQHDDQPVIKSKTVIQRRK